MLTTATTTPLIQDYQNLKSHFPDISQRKDEFFQQLSNHLPFESSEIQSFDGKFVDILWNNITISITEDNALSMTANGKFEYFEDCLEAIDFIVNNL